MIYKLFKFGVRYFVRHAYIIRPIFKNYVSVPYKISYPKFKQFLFHLYKN